MRIGNHRRTTSKEAKALKKPVAQRLPDDATLASIIDRLADPVKFVRKVFRTLPKGDRVRISVGSEPSVPDYRFEEVMEPDETGDGPFIVLQACSGRTHRALPEETEGTALWSTRFMDWSEVQRLMGRLNNWKG